MPELEDYLTSKVNWSTSKKARYRQSWEFFKRASSPGTPGYFDYAGEQPTIDTFPKAYEECMYYGRDITALKARPRNIGSLRVQWVYIHYLQAALLA